MGWFVGTFTDGCPNKVQRWLTQTCLASITMVCWPHIIQML